MEGRIILKDKNKRVLKHFKNAFKSLVMDSFFTTLQRHCLLLHLFCNNI